LAVIFGPLKIILFSAVIFVEAAKNSTATEITPGLVSAAYT
jgi:hypothetical protein